MRALGLVITLLFAVPAGAKDLEVKVSRADATAERYERDVDQVALASQQQAIAKLAGLLKKYRGTGQEPVLLSKLAELEQQNASIRFRIAHGLAHHTKKPLNLADYKGAMRRSISTLTELIRKYPRFADIAQAYFLRGKGFEEIEDKAAATRDYLHLVGNYPEAEGVVAAYMSLAGFAIEANDHSRAVTYLGHVEKRPDDPYYPFALYKLGWSHYNLKNIATALSYVERNVDYYRARKGSSDQALRENAILDAAIFYFEGYERKMPQYAASDALSYFRKLDDGPILGRAILRFAKLLRSHDHEPELVALKDQLLVTEPDRAETLEVALTSFEHQLNRRRFPELVETARDIVRLHGKNPKLESFRKAQKLLLDTAEQLQALVVRNKGADGVGGLSQTLAAIYDAFTRIVDEADPRIPRVHYNLAETLFEIREYERSAQNYRWIVERGRWTRKKGARSEPASVEDASLKAIAARYETLRQKQLIPGELVARAIGEKDGGAAMDPLLSEWVGWVDTHLDRTGDAIDNFQFESHRALYGAGRIGQAVERMSRFAHAHPSSKLAVPAASLVLDTHLAGQDWETAHETAVDFLEIKAWAGTDFSKRLFSAAADSAYKSIEALYRAKEHRSVLKRAEKFLKKYSSSARLPDCLSLAANAALAAGEKPLALEYFSRLIAEAPRAPVHGDALLARAALHEDHYRFAAAARDYRAYLGGGRKVSDEGQANAFRRKALVLAWLSSDAEELRSVLGSQAICTDAVSAACSKFEALLRLASRQPRTAEQVGQAVEKARKGPEEIRTVWAALALEDAKDLAYRDRLMLVRQAAAHWEELDNLARFAVLPHLSVSIPRALSLTRLSLREIAPLRARERHITHRVDVIREIENAAAAAMKLPWSRIRALVLNETASLYVDLSRDLRDLAPPKDLPAEELAAYDDMIRKLVLPFEEKGQELRGKAFELASRFAIEDEAFSTVAEPFFRDNPSQAKALRHAITMPKPAQLGLEMLDRYDPAGDWDSVLEELAEKNPEIPNADRDRAAAIRFHWAAAVREGRWQQVAYFLAEAGERKLVGGLGLLRAVSFHSAGARGEALAELEEARGSLSESAADGVTLLLIQHYLKSCSREKTKGLVRGLKAVEEDSPLAAAAKWAGGA
jgi:TolA-binding protein